jgi:microcystin degradation protein MlrC
MFRVGIVALLQESNTFLVGETTLEHFQQELLARGGAVRQHFAGGHHEVSGFFAELERRGIEAVPIFAARAVPFGTVTRAAYAVLLEQLLEELDLAGRIDGLLVAPHGATVSEDVPDVDGDWLTAVRHKVGPQVPVIGTMDPHANLSPAMVAATDALIAYRTNPHVDQFQRGVEAATLMARTLAGEIQPVQAATFPPMLINIERQCTSESPCRELAQEFEAVRGQRGVLSASLLLGFPYADVAEMGAACLVVADRDVALAQTLSNDLASRMWELRGDLQGRFVTVADAVRQAAELPSPVCLLDMGDNVGGGSPADGTWLAIELERQGLAPSFVCINDPEAVSTCEVLGVGCEFSLAMGGRVDPLHGPPWTTDVTVLQLVDGQFDEPEARHGGLTHFDMGRTAIVQTDSGLTVMLTSLRTPPFSLCQLTAFGLDPAAFRTIVAKGVNAPLAAYQPVCPSILRVNTPGVTMADVTGLPYHHRRRPMYPFEPETAWTP